jgi:hypothetical protein
MIFRRVIPLTVPQGILRNPNSKLRSVGLSKSTQRKVSFPVLLDPGRKVNEMFVVEGIPKSFVYGREGKLAAQSIDMRTQGAVSGDAGEGWIGVETELAPSLREVGCPL